MEKDILKEDIERFQQIMEYVQVGSVLGEDDKDPNADANSEGSQSNGPAPDFGGGMPGAAPNAGAMPGTDPNAGAMPGMDPNAGATPGMDPNAGAMPGMDPNAAAAPGADAQEGPEGFDPQVGDEPNMDIDDSSQPGPDDNVIDIDDLTSSQDATNDAIMGLDSKFDKLVGVIDKFLAAIDKNGEELSQVKQELEKRNPTPLEKLDLRSVNDSFPYNVKPTEFWKEKEENSNYRVGGDTNEVPKQYELHQSDIDNATDWKAISDSLDDDESINDLTKLLSF